MLTAAKVAKERKDSAPSVKEIKEGLPRRSETNSRQETHLAAMHYRDPPGLIRAVGDAPETVALLALLFTFYTCMRSGEVRGARWFEIDETAATWTVPGKRMKNGREHIVPLSRPALAVLARIGALIGRKPNDLIFPGVAGKEMSDATMAKAFKLAGGAGFTVHGSVRSGFRDWCAETQTSVPAAVA